MLASTVSWWRSLILMNQKQKVNYAAVQTLTLQYTLRPAVMFLLFCVDLYVFCFIAVFAVSLGFNFIR